MTKVKIAGLFLVTFPLLHGFVAALNCTSPNPKALFDAFEKELFPRKLLRPVKSFSDTLNVSIYLTLVGVLGVNEKAQSLTTFLWQVLVWKIEGLSWDEKECGTNRTSVPRENLWIPDVIISEFMDEDKSPKTPYVYLYNSGHVVDDKPVRVVSSCRLVIYTFPFDIQNCTLTFGSYLHFAEDIHMIDGIPTDQLVAQSRQVIQTRGEWELVDIKAGQSTLEITVGNYSEIKYFTKNVGDVVILVLISCSEEDCSCQSKHVKIILRRRPILYVINLLIPSCFLITLDLFSFLLPPESVDRASFKMTLIIGYTVFLLIMNDLLPITGNTTPLMNIYFSISLALMVASTLETVFVTNIQFSSTQYNAVPRWLSVLVLRYLAVVVCLPSKKKSNRITVCLQPPVRGMNTCIISSRDLQSISGDTPQEKSPPEPALEELAKLGRDLTAIRLQMDKHFQGNITSEEWKMIGLVIDRLLFGLYIVFISTSFITILSLWYASYTYIG